jgi:hypothetical protein
MKSLGRYVGPAVLGLGLAVGVGSCVNSTNVPKIIPQETNVTLENIFYYESDGPTCLYDSNRRLSASLDRRGMGVKYDVLVSDGDGIQDIWHGRSLLKYNLKYNDSNVRETQFNFFDGAPNKNWFRNSYEVHVTDMKGNETTFVFPLSYIKEHGKIIDHKFPNENGKCDNEF